MTAAELLGELAQAWLAAGAATLVALALRAPLRRLAGSRAVALAWALVPLAVLAVWLPPREAAPVAAALLAATPGALAQAVEAAPAGPSLADARAVAPALLALWLVGALSLLARQALREHRYRRALGPLARAAGDAADLRRAAAGAPVPAVVGLWRPRVVLPEDFEARHPGAEGALVLAHERAHLRHHDTRALALAELLRAALWPQPLLHLALPRLRRDLELAADAAVLAAHPAARRAYADALLRGALDAPPPPLACAWPASPHPLTERIAMLIAISPPRPRAARALPALLAALVAGAAWAAQPAVAPAAPASATATAPAADGAWLVHAELRIGDGVPVRIDVRGAPGEEHRIASGQWSATLRALPAPDPANVLLEAQLFRDGEPMAAPRLVGSLGSAMGIQFQLPDGGELLSMGVAVHVLEPGEDAPAFAVRAPATPPVEQADARAVATPVDISGLPASAFAGELVLEVDVDAAGRVTDVRVRDPESGVDPALQSRVIAAARQWRFAPAIRDGEAVASTVAVPLSFAPEAPPSP